MSNLRILDFVAVFACLLPLAASSADDEASKILRFMYSIDASRARSAAPAGDEASKILGHLSALEIWRAAPEVVLKWCDKEDPEGAPDRRSTYDAWSTKNAALIAQTEKYFNEVVPLVAPYQLVDLDAIKLQRAQVNLEITKVFFLGKNKIETANYCRTYSNPNFPTWSQKRIEIVRDSMALIDAWRSQGGPSTVREFTLPKFGYLALSVPKAWNDQVLQPPQDLPPTIIFRPRSGNGFQVLVSTFWAVRPGVTVPDKERIRNLVHRFVDRAKQSSMEKEIPVNEFVAAYGDGYYYSYTDKAPKPEEYKYTTAGLFRLGDIALQFTVLTNDGAETALVDATEMLKNAKHVLGKTP